MTDPLAEFSRPVRVDRLPPAEIQLDLVAEPHERAALARRFDLLELTALAATIWLKPMGRTGTVRLRGRLAADVVQACVVTLEPVPAHVEEEFELFYGESPSPDEEDPAELVLTPESEEPPDPIIDGMIDVGEAVAEHLALGLDPFPRRPGAAFDAAPLPEDERPNPFAVLRQLKKEG